MTTRPPLAFSLRLLELALRLGLGGAFVYAGWVKAQDPVGFADSVASFALLPAALISPFALALPIFEFAAGLLLLAGWPRRLGAFALMLLTAVFCVALVQALARGLTVNCGCFGPSASTSNPWLDLARDLAILAGCFILYRPPWRHRGETIALAGGAPG
ncbi:MAG: MauE/DoxX family redox-associated membrane protein [Candidatus Binataceae bacterium]